jgi:hypothetical protein
MQVCPSESLAHDPVADAESDYGYGDERDEDIAGVLRFQNAFGHASDLILFSGPHGSTLAMPSTLMFETREKARQVVRQKIAASRDAFSRAVDAESLEAVDRFWRTNSAKALRDTNIGGELAKREAA